MAPKVAPGPHILTPINSKINYLSTQLSKKKDAEIVLYELLLLLSLQITA